MGMMHEFKEFALKGNMLDLAVGIVLGIAFTAIVTSLVDDVLMPPIGVLLGGVDFSDKFIQLTMREQTFPSLAAAKEAGASVLSYGSFINAIIKFLIVAFALFIIVKQFNTLKKRMERQDAVKPAAAPLPADVVLLTEIRDLLRRRPGG